MANKATQFKQGEVNNPNGRPKKGYSITEMMKELLSTPIDGKDVRAALARSILDKALKGDIGAQKIIWQYMDGMPLQKNVFAGDEENPLRFIDAKSTLDKVYGSTNKLHKDSKEGGGTEGSS